MIFAIIPDFFLYGAHSSSAKKYNSPEFPRKFEVAGPEFGRRKFDPSGEELYSRGNFQNDVEGAVRCQKGPGQPRCSGSKHVKSTYLVNTE